MNFTKGSVWRKWDLHIHTPYSHLNNNFGNDWDSYVRELFKKAIEKQICAIGITDYFTIDGYKKIKNDYLLNDQKLNELFHASEIESIKNILIIPNIEFRLDIFVGDKSVNFHVLFSNEVETRDIEENFLHEIDFVYAGRPQDEEEKRKLKYRNLEELGRRLKTEHENFGDKSDIVIGMMNAVVNDKQITEILKKNSSKFNDRFLLGVDPDEDLSNVHWDSRDHQTRKVLIQKSDFLLSSNHRTITWALGEPPYQSGIKEFTKEFKSLKPCIHGSDAHSMDEIAHPCSKRGVRTHNCTTDPTNCDLRYCWIKSDLTFEGLKQIIYEPKLRVKIQADDPHESETYVKTTEANINLPDDLKIEDENGTKLDFCINGEYNLCFSNNLTCIIGSRGSGKSTLIHLFYNAWIDKDINKLNIIESPLLKLDLKPTPLKKITEATNINIPQLTEFFFQNEIEHFAKNIDAMSLLLKHRLDKLSYIDGERCLENFQRDCDISFNTVDQLISNYDKLSEFVRNINKLKEEISTLKTQTEIIKSEEYKSFQTNIEAISSEISNFKKYSKEYDEVYQMIVSLTSYLEKLNWDETQGIALAQKIAEVLNTHGLKLEQIYTKFKENYDSKKLMEQLVEAKDNLKNYLTSKHISDENIGELIDAKQKIIQLENNITEIEINKRPVEAFCNNKEQIILGYKNAYKSYFNRYKDVIALLERELIGLSISDKEIKFRLEFDSATLQQEIVAFIKELFNEDSSLKADVIKNLLFSNVEIKQLVEDKLKIREIINNSTGAEKHKKLLQELVNNDDLLEKIHLRILKEFYNVKNIQVQTMLGEKYLKNTSFGERCGIVISIILAAGTNPIIIDQPEDHLDGKFISTVLVPIIRKQKVNRQIILITRDANIVIGGDAELIHILEVDDRKTSIYSSSIENKEFRNKYIWILDGGEEAFNKREQKYNLSHIPI